MTFHGKFRNPVINVGLPCHQVPPLPWLGVAARSHLFRPLLPPPHTHLPQTQNSQCCPLRSAPLHRPCPHPGSWIPQKLAPGACPARLGSPDPQRPAS
uniref:Macaca fascicularis brain cDNA, clone: QflA-22069 n=2 Tax=Macaca TaxID=9539 RepID=I7GDD6_MACFA|nr:unnamed protein product [Macaca fascicularis]